MFYTTNRDKTEKKRKKREEVKEKSVEKAEQEQKIEENKIPLPDADTLERKIYDRLKNAKSPDELTLDGEDVSDVLTALTMLEIEGLIKAVPGGKFTRA